VFSGMSKPRNPAAFGRELLAGFGASKAAWGEASESEDSDEAVSNAGPPVGQKRAPSEEDPDDIWNIDSSRSKKARSQPAPAAKGREFLGVSVCLHGLVKAPSLNGRTGVAWHKDDATSRYFVTLDGETTVKQVKAENMKEVFTGSVIRLSGLVGQASLNGLIGECGGLSLEDDRYDVILLDGRKVRPRPENVLLVSKYAKPGRPALLGKQIHTAVERVRWLTYSEKLKELGTQLLPVPQLLASEKLVELTKGQATDDSFGELMVSGRTAPTQDDGRLDARIFLVSMCRDYVADRGSATASAVGALAPFAKWASQAFAPKRIFFLIPGLCVKDMTCLRSAAEAGWPLMVTICTDMLILNWDGGEVKSWCRLERQLAAMLAIPVYRLPKAFSEDSPAPQGWTLSDTSEQFAVAAPVDGQGQPRWLVAEMQKSLLPDPLPAQIHSFVL